MWKWCFSNLIKIREQVVADLGLNMPARPYEVHLDDFLTMLLRMAVTFTGAFVVAFHWAPKVGTILFRPLALSLVLDHQRLWLDGCDCYFAVGNQFADFWMVSAIVLSVPVLFFLRMRLRSRHSIPKLNFKQA